MRRCPPPLSVTLPPPSSTISGPRSLRILAVAFMVMVTGFGPQSNVMTPPWATVATTASDVQLPGVPSPMTWVGREVSAARASEGTATRPVWLPAGGAGGGAPVVGGGGGTVVGGAVVVVVVVVRPADEVERTLTGAAVFL